MRDKNTRRIWVETKENNFSSTMARQRDAKLSAKTESKWNYSIRIRSEFYPILHDSLPQPNSHFDLEWNFGNSHVCVSSSPSSPSNIKNFSLSLVWFPFSSPCFALHVCLPSYCCCCFVVPSSKFLNLLLLSFFTTVLLPFFKGSWFSFSYSFFFLYYPLSRSEYAIMCVLCHNLINYAI